MTVLDKTLVPVTLQAYIPEFLDRVLLISSLFPWMIASEIFILPFFIQPILDETTISLVHNNTTLSPCNTVKFEVKLIDELTACNTLMFKPAKLMGMWRTGQGGSRKRER